MAARGFRRARAAHPGIPAGVGPAALARRGAGARRGAKGAGAYYAPPPKYRYLKNGKPELLSGAPRISLAHAGDFAICAISDLPVGVDIEEKDRRSPMPVREWVGIESYLKLTGEGLSGSFRTLCAGEDEIYLLGRHAAYLARAELGNCLICAASDEPAHLTVVEAHPEEPPRAFSEKFS